MYISFIVNIRSSHTGLHGFQLRLYQQNKSSKSKAKFRQTSNYCKWVFEAASVTYASKKEPITSQKLGFRDVWRMANCLQCSQQCKSAIPPLFNGAEFLSSASDKAKLFTKNFSRNSIQDDSDISLPIFPSITNLKLHNFCNLQVG